MGLIKLAVEDESNGTGAARYENPKADETGRPIVSLSEAAAKIDSSESLENLMDLSRSKTSTGYSHRDDGWQRVVYPRRYRKQKPADRAADGGVSGKNVSKESLANGSSYNVLRELMVESKAEQAEEVLASLSEAAAKIDPSHLAAFLADFIDTPNIALWRFYFYLERAFSQVSLQWLKISPLLIDVPLSHIPTSVYETSADWINRLPTETHRKFVTWALCRTLSSSEPQVSLFIGLAMVLRSNPDALTHLLPMLRERPRYQGPDKLPLIVWVLAQASQGDLSGGLYSWAHVLLPLVGNNKSCSPRSMDLILQFVEIILSNPEARTILVNRPVREGERLIPPSSFEILVRLTFPAPAARVKDTKRFEAVYPLLKEVALAPESATGGNTVGQIFTFSLKLAGEEGNPGLAKEAAAIAIRCVTEDVDCFKEWAILYKEHLQASVALLRKLVDEWKIHSPELSSSPCHALTVNRTLNSFRLKNEKAITEGGANSSLYKEAHKSCKLISRRLGASYYSLYNEADKSCKLFSRRLFGGSGGLNITHIAAVVLAAAAGAALTRIAIYIMSS